MKNAVIVAVLAVLSVSCRPGPEPEPTPRFSLTELRAKSAADLGPDFVDVSAYPEAQQKNYRVFRMICGQCHTLARAINHPAASRADWDRLVHRMHGKTVLSGWWTDFAKTDAKSVLSFLAYDSQIRKIDKKAEFERGRKELEASFIEVQAERARYDAAVDRAKAAARGSYIQ